MIKHAFILAFLLAPAFLASRGQNSELKPAEKFIAFLNGYQADSLQIVVADNFQLNRTYTSYSNNKRSLLENYVPDSKNLHAKFKIINSTVSGQTTSFLAEDQSDFFRYLQIEYPVWSLQIVTNDQGKVERMTIDTTENYRAYLTQALEKAEAFDNWLKQKYPEEAGQLLYISTGVYIKRLKEYANR